MTGWLTIHAVYHWAFWVLMALAAGMIVLSVRTPWRQPGGIPHREHVGFCAAGLLTLGMISMNVRDGIGGVAVELAVLAAIFLIVGVRSYRAGRAAAAASAAGPAV